MDAIINVYIDMIKCCMPFCLAFGFGNMAVGTVLRAIFGGRLVIK